MLVTISVLESLWATALLGWVLLSYFPKTSPLITQVFSEWRFLVQPEWDTELYHFFIFSACLVQAALIYSWYQCLENQDLWRRLRTFLLVESAWVGLVCAITFKDLVYPQRHLDRVLFLIFLFLSFLWKIGWVSHFKWQGSQREK